MAFKMTPGIKGNSTNNSIMGGGCGGDGQPPCPPRFQAEKMMAPVADKSSSSRSKSIRVKKKAAVVTPVKPPKPVKFKINLPKGYGFLDKRQEAMFFDMFEQAISAGKYKTQEDLDMAVMKQLKGGKPRDPKEVIQSQIKINRAGVPMVVYQHIASNVGVTDCRDGSFGHFRNTLRTWFP